MEELGGFERALLGLTRAVRRGADGVRGRVVVLVGGTARARVISLFGCVLALNSAQIATIGAIAPQLESALHIGNTKIGLLNSVALLVGAVATIPVGLLVDRVRRIPVLAGSILLWSGATLWGALASSYSGLLLSRVGLGAVAATAGPAIASLTGDYFPAGQRARVYGYILAGEVAGTAAGFVVSGLIASALSWRISLLVLALPGFWLARELFATVPEPERGGQSRLAEGAEGFVPAGAAAGVAEEEGPEDDPATAETVVQERDLAADAARRSGVKPNPRLVLRSDPRQMGLFRAIGYIMRVPTNVLLILGSSLGYFYFAGLQTFALVFLRGRYQASEATATLILVLLVAGALIGTLASGPLTDALVRRGYLRARVWLPGFCYLGAALLLVIGLLNSHLTPAIWFDVGGATLISAANPPLDAARLDIMPSGLWGRAESTRTFLRSLTQALAPLLFGGVADLVAGFVPAPAPIGTHAHNIVSSSTGTGLQVSFLIMVTTLAAGGIFILRARDTYPSDVATAAASFSPGG
jgi:MFS family permease